MKKLVRALRIFWKLSAPFWFQPRTEKERGNSRLWAWLILATVLAMTLGSVYINVRLNTWSNDFYDALQRYNEPATLRLVGVFTILAFIYIGLSAYSLYLRQRLQIRWRIWMTDQFLRMWTDRKAFYLWHLTGQTSDNPDQRISEDIQNFTDQSLSLFFSMIEQTSTLFMFSVILWSISPPLSVGGKIIPGLLFWSSLLYAIVGTSVLHLIGRKIIPLNVEQQHFEADFRYQLVRLRENSEGIAFLHGEEAEKRGLKSSFENVVRNFLQIIQKTKYINLASVGYNQIANIFPLLLLLPGFFAKKFLLGRLIQVSGAFGSVSSAFSFFLNSYTSIAYWCSVVERLERFSDNIDACHALSPEVESRFRHEGTDLRLDHMSLTLPNGQSLADSLHCVVRRGESTLITGASGTGKSTLFRTVAGLWPYFDGKISLPAGARLMVLPQKPYLPLGTLASALTYPEEFRPSDQAPINEWLRRLSLSHLIDRLAEVDNWSLRLSPGEQQRISIIRVLLQMPDWLLLDEATSALDEEMQTTIYRLLQEKLPHTTIISVAHRESLRQFHRSEYNLKTGKQSALPETPVSPVGVPA